jgi:hypothetical protein
MKAVLNFKMVHYNNILREQAIEVLKLLRIALLEPVLVSSTL